MSELTPASVKKLKVAELRAELTKLGLDTKGNKPVLVERLLEAIATVNDKNDTEEVTEQTDESGNTEENSQEESKDDTLNDEAPENPPQAVVNDKPSEEVADQKMVEEEAKVEEPSEPEVVANQNESKEDSLPDSTEKADETINEEKEQTVEEPKVVTQDEGEKKESVSKDSKEEPMDQTPAGPTSESKESAKQHQEPVDLDVSVDFSKVEEEPDEEIDDSLVVLDKYNSDLFIKISPEALSCSIVKDNCFVYVCGGARATWGVTGGKVCYEVKFQAKRSGLALDTSEEPGLFVRVGWSVESANLQLGEDVHSYGYDSTGKKCTNSEFSDFGQTFDKDDVITCYLDLESEVKKISFSKNGEDLGDAFELPEDVQGKALYPHVVIRNTECTFNFGSQEEPWFAPKEEFTFIQNVSDESKVRASCGPSDKADCEVLMLIGLPASGKSTWAKKYITEHPDKRYNILGTSVVLDKMKLLGVARKQEVGGYNKNMDKAAKCLHRLFEIAPSKKRNYILDQTNVYQTAQSKKMRSFEGFKKKAIVCVPDQEVLKKRIQDRKNEGLELPHNAICDMKRNFVLPTVGDLFDEVSYIDQDEEQSKTIVAEYVKEGNSQRTRTYSGSGEPDRKRPRQDYRPRHGGFGSGGGGGWSGGGSHRDYRRYDDRRGGYRSPQSQYNRRGGGYQQYGRGGRGGYRDNYRGGRGGYGGGGGGGYHDRNRHSGGGNRSYGGSGGGGKSYGGGSYGGGSHSNQQRQQYSYSNQQQQQQSYTQQPQTQQQSYGSYNQYSQYQQSYQQYGQQTQQQQPQTQGYQQYPAYYQQQGTYQQGGYSGYGY